MQLPHLTILITAAVMSAASQRLPPGALTSIIQDILSPKNTQQLQTASMPTTVTRRYAITETLPKTVVKTELPKNTVVVQKTNEIVVPKNVIVQKGTQIVIPRNKVARNEVTPKFMQNGEGIVTRKVIVRNGNELPRRVVMQSNDAVLRAPQPVEVQQKVLVNPAKAQMNPFQPTGTLSNPVPQSRGQFLRKIPIPPPTL